MAAPERVGLPLEPGDAEPLGLLLGLGDPEPVGLVLGVGEPVGLVVLGVGDGLVVLGVGDGLVVLGVGDGVLLGGGDGEPVGLLVLGVGVGVAAGVDGDADAADGEGDAVSEGLAALGLAVVLAVAAGEGVTVLAAAGSRVPMDSPETRQPPATRPATTVRPHPKYMRTAHSALCVRIECDDPVSGSVPAVTTHPAGCDEDHIRSLLRLAFPPARLPHRGIMVAREIPGPQVLVEEEQQVSRGGPVAGRGGCGGATALFVR